MHGFEQRNHPIESEKEMDFRLTDKWLRPAQISELPSGF
jgi:hypothetical protein